MGKKSKLKKIQDADKSEIVDDSDRFDVSKPQFRRPKDSASKVTLDDRFSSILTDPKFQLDIKDKYGRSNDKRKNVTKHVENLSEFYVVESNKDNIDNRDKIKLKDDQLDILNNNDTKSTKNTSGNEKVKKVEEFKKKEQKEEDPSTRIAYLRALSRGELDLSSSSDEDDDNSQNNANSDEDDDCQSKDSDDSISGKVGVLDPSSREDDVAEISYEPSTYLAVMNLDWSHVRAVDVFTIVSSFTPPGAVTRVRVYPSDFGMERMAVEEKLGPLNIWKDRSKVDLETDSSSVEDLDTHSQKYQGKKHSTAKVDIHDNQSEDEDSMNSVTDQKDKHSDNLNTDDTDFDAEKLREYEASKLKYYFAVVDFASTDHADIAYKEVDGIEFEHSSAAVDVRSIPMDSIENVISGRKLRDEATCIPSNYEPPEFVVHALQQSSVQCTWEAGDSEREKILTKYNVGEAWGAIAERDDLKSYLASDVSSDEDESDCDNKKSSRIRKMLGLEIDETIETKNEKIDSESDSDNGNNSDDEAEEKEVSFIPGKTDIKEKNTTRLESKNELTELSPWEMYLEKKKQKRQEKRQVARMKRKEVKDIRQGKSDTTKDEFPIDDDFLVTEGDLDKNKSKKNSESRNKVQDELALLVAGDDDDEEKRNFDMRGIERLEKNKDKKLRGSRKRKEDEFASNVTGTSFKIDFNDDRFQKVLDGSDSRFGIDRTDPNFKETSGMLEILGEQARRRKKRRAAEKTTVAVETEPLGKNSDPSTLNELVNSIKSKVKHKAVKY